MKTAVIITGQARTFELTRKTLDWCLFRKLPEPHFFVSVADDKHADSLKWLGEKYPLHFEKHSQPEIEEPKEPNLDLHSGWPRSATIQNILKQFWALERGWEFFNELRPAEHFDLFVRCRPDLWMQDIKLPKMEDVFSNDCWTPWWGTFGGINDRLAIMGWGAACAYFPVFSERQEIWKEGCPLHPETMHAHALRRKGVNVIPRLLAEFQICRLPDAEHQHPWLVPEGIMKHELAALHAWK